MQIRGSFIAACFCKSYFVPIAILGVLMPFKPCLLSQSIPDKEEKAGMPCSVRVLWEYICEYPWWGWSFWLEAWWVLLGDIPLISSALWRSQRIISSDMKESNRFVASLPDLTHFSLFASIWVKKQEYVFPNILGCKQWLPATMGM